MPIESIMKEFNEWIADLEVEDVPCVGRKFIRYRPNGTKFLYPQNDFPNGKEALSLSWIAIS